MSQQQREAVDRMLRSLPPTPDDLPMAERRAGYDTFMARDVPDDVKIEPTVLGGRPALSIVPGDVTDEQATILYLHGGAFVMGSPDGYAGFTAQLTRRAGAAMVSLDYRLAPEHPYPAAVDDCLAAYRELLEQGVPAERIVIAGDSAGGNLALVTLLGAREAGLPMPAAAAVFSPLTDFTGSGASVQTKDGADPVFGSGFLEPVRAAYLGDQDPRSPLVSPHFAQLQALPPLLIQVGSNEVMLDDAVGFAGRAGAAEVDVTLEIVGQVPHVFPMHYEAMEEADAALTRAAQFLSRHLTRS
ncbi:MULTISPECIES: alpha/beta hydrolase [Actinoplanes]|uniref:alpha/beta hydrolase n=1 Tax=Actinoplanes TaxID=1865 RepID=UPI0005F28069|nr:MULTISPECIES: alpha/beta hydrolase [Actinoplanes]GLY02254.1 alpha/beta hydrolase [Actinoplanes sp. NBRC 101535]